MKVLFGSMKAAAGIAAAVLALGSVAAPALAEEVRISVADLNLNTPEGRAQFDARMNTAAWRSCESDRELSRREGCMRAFREEANENLQAQLERLARQQGVNVASARR